MIAKVDGKNYLLMLQEGPEAAEKMAMDIVGAIRKHSNGHGVVSVPDITFGYYQANIGQVRFEEACRRAKQTYKLAAANGKNWGTYRYETAHELDKVESLEKTILQAIADDSFFLEFQPFIDAAQGTIVGGEVLSRLHDEREGLVMPRYFLQAVESSSCYSRFDYYIFEKTCKWAACQTSKELKYLSINFSRYSLSEPDFSQNIIQIADSYHIPHDILAVEITEEEQEKSHPNVRSNLNALHEAGFSIFLDDFGSGFTSLDDLQNYRIDVVKIDKKILNLTTTQKGRIVFSSVAAMARQLGCQVLCEGVETAEQLETAQAAECDLIQGFYYYHSLPAEEFSCLLGHRVEPTGATATMAEPELRTDQERLTALGIIDAGL